MEIAETSLIYENFAAGSGCQTRVRIMDLPALVQKIKEMPDALETEFKVGIRIRSVSIRTSVNIAI